MRGTFINTVTRLARADPRVMLVIGDTGFSVVEPFEEEFGQRFVNVGIAEQNFVAFAAGLAAQGMRPFAYNVVSFLTLRGTEQILLDLCYQENPVVLVGVGGGFAYGPAGPTHHALSDIAIMRAFPNMAVFCPGDPAEMEAVTLAASALDRPAYIRIGRSVDPAVHAKPISFQFGRALSMREGEDIAILACGTILKEAVQACSLLSDRGASVSLYSFPTVKPLDVATVLDCALRHKAVFTVEEHSAVGGFGSAVAEVLAQSDCHPRFKIYGVPDAFAELTGSRAYQLDYFGLSPEKLADDMWARWSEL